MAIDTARKRFAALNSRSGRGLYIPPQSSAVVKRYMLLCLYPFVSDAVAVQVYYFTATVPPVSRSSSVQPEARESFVFPVARDAEPKAISRSAFIVGQWRKNVSNS